MGGNEKKETTVQAAARNQPSYPGPDLELVYQDHHVRVMQAAYRITGNASDAEDVLQNVFLRLLRRGEAPSDREHLGSYLHRAAINASIDLLRTRKPSQRVPLDDVQHQLQEEGSSAPDQSYQGKELRDWLRGAIALFSPQAAEIFALRYLEDYSNQEIAELVDTSPGVVAVVLHRCRNRLRDEIRSFLGEPS